MKPLLTMLVTVSLLLGPGALIAASPPRRERSRPRTRRRPRRRARRPRRRRLRPPPSTTGGGLSYGKDKAKKNPPLGWAIVNFTILIFLLVRLVGKPFRDYLRVRSEKGPRRARLGQGAARARAGAAVRDRGQAVAPRPGDKRDKRTASPPTPRPRRRRSSPRPRPRPSGSSPPRTEPCRTSCGGSATSSRARRSTPAMAAAEKLLKQQVSDADRKRLNRRVPEKPSQRGRAIDLRKCGPALRARAAQHRHRAAELRAAG